MKAATGAVLVVALLACLPTMETKAATFYRYLDSKTGRDVFVDRLEQVPSKFRPQAKVVFDTGALANPDEVKQAAPPPADDGLADQLIKELAPAATDGAKDLRHASADRGSWRDPAGIAATTVNAKLARAGARSLDEAERTSLAGFIRTALSLAVVAVLFAFVAWLVLVVCAFRDQHPVWGVLMLLLWPASYLYLMIHFAKGRLALKTVAGLGLLSPTLVALWVSWRFYAWFQLIAHARGGSA